MALTTTGSFGNTSASGVVLVWGRYLSIITASLTVVTFALALIAVPVAGSFCPANCVDYPYLDILDQFPKDYLWMYPAIVLSLVFVALMATIHEAAAPDRKFFALIGLSFAVMSSTILVIDYFVQVSVVQPSLELGETEGIALITMFNEHGIFVALEDIGYLLMAAAMGAVAPVLDGKNWREQVVRWAFFAAPLLTFAALVLISIRYGIWRGYIFEVVAISINWLMLIVGSTILSGVFKRANRALTAAV